LENAQKLHNASKKKRQGLLHLIQKHMQQARIGHMITHQVRDPDMPGAGGGIALLSLTREERIGSTI
jgi:hypothetical protein